MVTTKKFVIASQFTITRIAAVNRLDLRKKLPKLAPSGSVEVGAGVGSGV